MNNTGCENYNIQATTVALRVPRVVTTDTVALRGQKVPRVVTTDRRDQRVVTTDRKEVMVVTTDPKAARAVAMDRRDQRVVTMVRKEVMVVARVAQRVIGIKNSTRYQTNIFLV